MGLRPRARDPSTTYFLKAGYQAHIFSFGPSDFAIQGGQTRNRINDGDIASRIGVSFDQQVIARGVELYGGYDRLARVASPVLMQFMMPLIACLGPLLLAGCNLREEPFTYSDQKEMSGRPGLFTGRSGSIVLLHEEGSPVFDKD